MVVMTTECLKGKSCLYAYSVVTNRNSGTFGLRALFGAMNKLTFKLIMAVTSFVMMTGDAIAQERGGRVGDNRRDGARRERPERGERGGDRGRRPQFGGQAGQGSFMRTLPIMTALDADRNEEISAEEIKGAVAALRGLDKNKDGKLTAEELRPSFSGNRRGRGGSGIPDRSRVSVTQSSESNSSTKIGKDEAYLKQLWSYGLISRRTGSPLIEAGGEHRMDKSKVSYGHNVVVDRDGKAVRPGGRPLQGGEQLKLSEEYQKDKNVRELARVYTIMAPIRDAILYEFENTSREEWLKLTKVLAINNIKTTKTATIGPRSVLSSEQVYDYVARGPRVGSPVMRFLEEAELELKCLAFVDVKIPAAAAAMARHSEERNIDAGSGIKLP